MTTQRFLMKFMMLALLFLGLGIEALYRSYFSTPASRKTLLKHLSVLPKFAPNTDIQTAKPPNQRGLKKQSSQDVLIRYLSFVQRNLKDSQFDVRQESKFLKQCYDATRLGIPVTKYITLNDILGVFNRTETRGLSPSQFSHGMYILRFSEANTPHLSEYITFFCQSLERSGMKLSGRNVAHSVNGLRNLPLSPELITFFRKLNKLIQESPALDINPSNIALILQGIDRIDTSHPNVHKFLSMIASRFLTTTLSAYQQDTATDTNHTLNNDNGHAPIVAEFNHTLFQTLVSAYGQLRGHQSTPGILAVLSALNSKLEIFLSSGYPLKFEQVADISYALRDITEISLPVQHCLKLLSHFGPSVESTIEEVKGTKHMHYLSKAFNGLRRMRTQQPEEMSSLVKKIPSLSGHVSHGHVEVNAMVAYLLTHLRSVRDKQSFDISSFSDCVEILFGLQHISSYDMVDDAINSVHSIMSKMLSNVSDISAPSANDGNATHNTALLPPGELSRAMYALRKMHYQTSAPLLHTLIETAVAMHSSNTTKCREDELAMFASGLTEIGGSSDSDHYTGKALAWILKKMQLMPQTKSKSWNVKTLSMFMLSLKKIKEDSLLPFVYAIMGYIGTHVAVLDTAGIANILYSLQDRSSSDFSVRKFVKQLVSGVKKCKEVMTSKELGMALLGLQGMDSKHNEVKELVAALNIHIKRSREKHQGVFSAHGIANAISGLQSMSNTDDCEALKELMVLLVEELEKCQELMLPQNIANAIFGLQGMTSESEEVRAIIYALGQKLKELAQYKLEVKDIDGRLEKTLSFSLRDISYCITGLAGMQRHLYQEVDDLIDELQIQFAQTPLGSQTQAITFKQYGKGFRVSVGKKRVQSEQDL